MLRWTLPATLLLITPLLAGCIGNDQPVPLAPAEQNQRLDAARALPADRASNADAPVHPVSLPSDAPLEAIEVFEATFDPSNACNPASCVVGMGTGEASHQARFDLSHLVSLGVPTVVDVTLSHNLGDGAGHVLGTLWMDLVTPLGVVAEGDTELSHVLVQRAPGPVELVVEYGTPEPDQVSTDVTVEVQTRANPANLAPGVPVGFEVGPETEALSVQASEGRALLFTLYGPDDRLLGRFSGTGTAWLALPDDAPTGEYALVVHEPGRTPVQLSLVGPTQAPNLRVLPTELVWGAPVTPDDQAMASWSFDVQDPLLLAGVRIETGQTSWVEGLTSDGLLADPSVHMEGPNGTLLTGSFDFGFNCVICYPPRDLHQETRPGAQGLLPGGYNVTVENVHGQETQVFHVLVTWHR